MHVYTYTIVLSFKFPAKIDNGRTWLFLINGGEKSFEEEKIARDELKKIYHCFVSNKLVKPEHVVCASGGKEKLFQHETITDVSKVSSVVSPIPKSTKFVNLAAHSTVRPSKPARKKMVSVIK